MQTHRFGRRLKLPAKVAIKYQIRKLMFEDLVKEAEAIARAEAIRPSLSEEPRLAEHIPAREAVLAGRVRASITPPAALI
jgi:hypothetical protein